MAGDSEVCVCINDLQARKLADFLQGLVSLHRITASHLVGDAIRDRDESICEES